MRMTSHFKFAAVAGLCATTINTWAAPVCTQVSGPQRAALVELYTSEGCDSCPPADKWLSTLKADTRVIPLAFHVDYWDYIGWKDRFATAGFGDRQRARVAAQNSRSVYTPQVMMNGRDAQDWHSARGFQILLEQSATQTARIKLEVKASKAGSVVSVEPSASALDAGALKGAKFYFALYENGLVSDVKAGENRGVTLKHDYVVRKWMGPVELGTQKITVPSDANAEQLGVAVIAEDAKGGLLQAVALPLGGC
jgi:hypothetical protein